MAEPWELGSQVEKPRQERGEGSVDLYSPDTDVVQQPLTPEQKVERFTAYWAEHAQERKRREREAARVAALEAQLAAPPSAPSAAPLPQPTDVVAAKQAKKKKKGGVISGARTWWERRRYRVKEKLKHPKEVQLVEAHLREHYEETETQYLVTAKRSQKKIEKQRKKLVQRGYREDGEQHHDDAVRYSRPTPMELSKGERKNVDALLEIVDRPIEVLRAIEALGVAITGVTFYGDTFQERTAPLARVILGREQEIIRFFSKIRVRPEYNSEYESRSGAGTVQQIVGALYDPEVSAALSLSEVEQAQLVTNMRCSEQYAGSEEKKQIGYPALPAVIRYAQHREQADSVLHYTRLQLDDYERRRSSASDAAVEFDILSRLRVVERIQQLQQAGITLPRRFIERILPTRDTWTREAQDAAAARMQEAAISLILDLDKVIENRALMETARVVHEVTGRTVDIGSVETEFGQWIGHAHELAGLLEAVLEAGFYVRSGFGRGFFEESEPRTVAQYMDPGYIQFVKLVRETLGLKIADLEACFMPRYSETAGLYTLYAQSEIRTALEGDAARELLPLVQPIILRYDLTRDLQQLAELTHVPRIVETIRFFSSVSPEEKRTVSSFFSDRELLQQIGVHPSFSLLSERGAALGITRAVESTDLEVRATPAAALLSMLEYARRGGSVAEFFDLEHAETVYAANSLLRKHAASLYISRDHHRRCSGVWVIDAQRFNSLQGLVGELGRGITIDLDDIDRFAADPEAVRRGHQRVTHECGVAHDGNTTALLAVAQDQSWETNKGAVLQALEDTPSWKRNPEAISLLFQAFASSPTEMQAIMQLNRRVFGRGSEMSGWGVEQLRELIAFAPYHRQLERLATLVGNSAFKMFSRLAPEHLTVLMELGDDVITRALQHVYIDNTFDIQMFIEFGTLIQRAGSEYMERIDRELGQWSIDCTDRPLNEWRVLFNEVGLQHAVAQRRFEQRRNVRGYSDRWTVARTEKFARINSPEALAMIHTMESTPQDVYIFEYPDADVVLDLVAHPEHWEQMQAVAHQYEWGLRSIISEMRRNPLFVADVQGSMRAAAIHRAYRELYSAADRSSIVGVHNFDEWEMLPVDLQDIPELMRYVHLLDYIKPEGVAFLAGVMHDPEKKLALQLLNEGGIRNIEISSLNILLESPDEREQVVAGVQELTQVFPRYRYYAREFIRHDADGAVSEQRRVLDPYFVLFDSMQHETLRELWSTPPFDTTQLPPRYSHALMRSLRMSDRTLVGSEVERYDIDPTQLEQFHNAIEQLRAASQQHEDIPAFQEILKNRSTLLLIARQPRRVAELVDLPTAVPELFRLLAPGGPLHANLSGTIGTLFENGSIIRRARELTTVFTKKLPLWSALFLYTDMRLGGTLASTDSAFPVDDVVGLSIRTMRQHHLRMKSEHPEAPTSLEHAIADTAVREQVLNGEIEAVPVSSLSGVFKRLVFREMIQQTVERSRDDGRKHQADRRNRTLAQPQLTFDRPTGIHGTRSVDVLPSILLNGNLPQESLGERASVDSRPFHFDFFLVKHPEKTGHAEDAGLTTMDAVLKGTNLNTYFSEQGVALLYDRSGMEAYQHDKEVPGTAQGPQHFMIFGGMPATEVRGIVCRSQEQVPKITQAILEAGFYIPVYTIDGTLQLSADQYDALREESNMAVPVMVWDTSMKTGAQLGSNAGGEYTAPAREGPVRYYVKFSRREGAGDRLWNEQLADNMYRAMGIAVPETEVVRIGNDYGHASRIFEKQEGPMVDFKDGFIMDAWLANWDVVFERNRAEYNGRTVRLDNGGSLLYRAQGERRTSFGPVVGELDTMRASYVGLTDEEVRAQALQLQQRMTNEVIDQLVDSVRLPKAERDGLKQVLKDRRDYIVEEVFAQSTEAVDDAPVPVSASEVIELFGSQQRDHAAIGGRISEWYRLMSEEGYQHNGVLLGQHLMDAVDTLRATPEFAGLTPKEQQLAVVATVFHDMGKPTGRREERVERDFDHEIPSIAIARKYMDEWGMSKTDQRIVSLAIQYDGVVSDIARGKVRDDSKNMTPAQLRAAMKANERAIRVLRAVNRADVVATVGQGAYDRIAGSFERFFVQMNEVS